MSGINMDYQDAISHGSEANRSILKNSLKGNNAEDQQSGLRVTEHVKFVDRAQNAPLHRLHEVDKIEYESEHQQTSKKSGHCSCNLL